MVSKAFLMSCFQFQGRLRPLAWAALLVAGAAGSANAATPTMSSNGSNFNSGIGFGSGELNAPISVNTRDENGNRLVVDGVMKNQNAAPNVFSSGVGDYGGSGGATAIGNNLTVTTIGSHNTVIINNNQVNNGNVTAGTVLNGSINLDPGV